jgi:uncharacterized protein
MGLRPAMIAMLCLVAGAEAPVAAVAAPPAGATLLAKASQSEPGHRSAALKAPPRIVELDWKELLPEGERAHFTAVAPPPVHDYRGEGGPPAVQAQDFNVNKSLEGTTIRLPGFIVPLEPVKNDGTSSELSEFLLVPYFGSCIHVPPPPPNQIVYVHTTKRTGIESIYDAYWITGKLHLQTKNTRLGSTAYELSADKIEVYKY